MASAPKMTQPATFCSNVPSRPMDLHLARKPNFSAEAVNIRNFCPEESKGLLKGPSTWLEDNLEPKSAQRRFVVMTPQRSSFQARPMETTPIKAKPVAVVVPEAPRKRRALHFELPTTKSSAAANFEKEQLLVEELFSLQQVPMDVDTDGEDSSSEPMDTRDGFYQFNSRKFEVRNPSRKRKAHATFEEECCLVNELYASQQQQSPVKKVKFTSDANILDIPMSSLAISEDPSRGFGAHCKELKINISPKSQQKNSLLAMMRKKLQEVLLNGSFLKVEPFYTKPPLQPILEEGETSHGPRAGLTKSCKPSWKCIQKPKRAFCRPRPRIQAPLLHRISTDNRGFHCEHPIITICKLALKRKLLS